MTWHRWPKFRVFDSDLDEEYPRQGMYAMAYEPLWQVLRLDCMKHWNTLPEARACCARLAIYVQRNKREVAVRRWRVFNLLNSLSISVTSAIGIHVMEMAAADYVIAYRETVRTTFYANPLPTEWDWAISRRGLIALMKRNPDVLVYLVRMLSKRRNRERVELQHYLQMNIEVMASYPNPD